MQKQLKLFLTAASLSACAFAQADIVVQMHAANEKGIGKSIGKVVISETGHGLVFTPALTGLAPGLHGFHVHEHANCEAGEKDGKTVPAHAAGGHYDPEKSGRHGAPWGNGHRGDLPALFVDAKGNANQPVLAPRLKIGEVEGRALMIHEGGDNFSDDPAPLGGGGSRVACGLISGAR